MVPIILYPNAMADKDKLEVPLLWVSIIFCEYSCYGGGLSDVFYATINYDNLSDKQKLNWHEVWMEITKTKEEDKTVIRNLYQSLRTGAQTKHKSRELLIAYGKLKQSKVEIENAIKKHNREFLLEIGAFHLLPLIQFEDLSLSRPIRVLNVSATHGIPNSEKVVEAMHKLIADIKLYSLFHSIEEQNLSSYSTHTLPAQAESVYYLTDTLFECPWLLNLNHSQAAVLRNEISAISWKLMSAIDEIKLKFKEIDFEAKNYAQLVELYTTATKELKENLQKEIANNALLQETENNYPNDKKITLNIGFASYSTLLKIYNTQQTITDTVMVYLQEEVATIAPINKTTIFLYISKFD